MKCDEGGVPGLSRRTFLRFSLGTGAGAAASALPARLRAEQAEAKGAPAATAKAVILLWMTGGPSQIETWDPKPGSRNGGEFKAIDTTGGPLMKFSEHLKICATQGRHLNVIRSMFTQEDSHERGTSLMHLGLTPPKGVDAPALGTVLSFEKGRKDFPLPHFIAIDPPLLPSSPALGEEYRPCLLSSPDAARAEDRAALLRGQIKDWDGKRREKEAKAKGAVVQSGDVMTSPLMDAFNYYEEPAELRKQYGDGFGANCLLARRLTQAGCSFIEVGLGGWDMHADVSGGCRRLLPTLDSGMGTLIKDLAEKDLLKETLVIWAGEFGRTPGLNAGRGRDHYADGFSVVLAGGSLAGGRVYGDTGANGDQVQRPVPVHTLFATIYKACGIDPTKEYESGGRKLKYAPQKGNLSRGATPLKDLF